MKQKRGYVMLLAYKCKKLGWFLWEKAFKKNILSWNWKKTINANLEPFFQKNEKKIVLECLNAR